MHMTIEEEIMLWRMELDRAEKKLEEARRYDNLGDLEWFAEKKRWAEQKLKGLETHEKSSL